MQPCNLTDNWIPTDTMAGSSACSLLDSYRHDGRFLCVQPLVEHVSHERLHRAGEDNFDPEVLAIFQEFDTDRSGLLEKPEILLAIARLGSPPTPTVCSR